MSEEAAKIARNLDPAVRAEVVKAYLLDSLAGNPALWPREEFHFMQSLIEGERQLIREFSARLIRRHFRFGHPQVQMSLVDHFARLVEGEGIDDEWQDHGPHIDPNKN